MDTTFIGICIVCQHRVGTLTSNGEAGYVPRGQQWSLCPFCSPVLMSIYGTRGLVDRYAVGEAVRQAEEDCASLPIVAKGFEAPVGSPERNTALDILLWRIAERYGSPEQHIAPPGAGAITLGPVCTCIICQTAYGNTRGSADLAAIPRSEEWSLCEGCLSTLKRISTRALPQFDWFALSLAHYAALALASDTTEPGKQRYTAFVPEAKAILATRGESPSTAALKNYYYEVNLLSIYPLVSGAEPFPPDAPKGLTEGFARDRDAALLTSWRATLMMPPLGKGTRAPLGKGATGERVSFTLFVAPWVTRATA